MWQCWGLTALSLNCPALMPQDWQELHPKSCFSITCKGLDSCVQLHCPRYLCLGRSTSPLTPSFCISASKPSP